MTESAPVPEFDTPERTERLQLVAHLLRNTQLVPWLRGPEGAGKSRLLDRLAAELATEFAIQRLDPLAADDGPEPADADVAGQLWLVDDADRLDPAATAALLAARTAGARLVLAGEHEPTGAWDPTQLQPVDLPPLDREQARDFLAAAGYTDAALWDDPRLDALHRQAEGRPGALLALADDGPVLPAETGGAWKWLVGAAAAGVVVLVLWQQERINAWFAATAPAPAPAPTAETVQQPETAAAPTPDPNLIPIPPLPEAVEPDAAAEQVMPAGQPAAMPAEQAEPVAAAEFPAAEPATDAAGPESQMTEPAVADASQALAVARDPEPEAAVPAEPAMVAEDGRPQPPVAPAPAEPSAAPAPAPSEPKPEPRTDAEPAPATQPPAPAAPKAPVAPPSEPPVAPAPAPQVAKAPPQDAIAWLRSRQAGHYTLQLLGARDRAAVDAFIRRHGLSGKYAVFARDLDGKPWYSLVYGDYPDRDAAVRARARLPAGLRKAWPRTFASVWEQLPADAGAR